MWPLSETAFVRFSEARWLCWMWFVVEPLLCAVSWYSWRSRWELCMNNTEVTGFVQERWPHRALLTKITVTWATTNDYTAKVTTMLNIQWQELALVICCTLDFWRDSLVLYYFLLLLLVGSIKSSLQKSQCYLQAQPKMCVSTPLSL